MNHRPLLGVAAAMPITLGLCAPEPGPEPEPAPVPGPTEQTTSAFADLLADVPAEMMAGDDSPMLLYVDMARVWDRAGVGEDVEERVDNIRVTFDPETYSQMPQMFGNFALEIDEARTEVGFSAFEIEREVAVLAPPSRVIVAETTVPASEVLAALETDPTWSAELREVTGDGGSYFEWAEDGMQLNAGRTSAFRPLGQAGQVAVSGEPATVIRTLDAEDMVRTQQTIAGEEPSLAEDGPFAEVASVLGDVEVIQATGIAGVTPSAPPAGPAASAPETFVFQPYEGILVTEVIAGGSVETRILLPHASAEAADANLEPARRFLAEGIDPASGRAFSELLPGAVVTVEDTTLVVTLRGAGNYRIPLQMMSLSVLFPVS